MKNPLLNFNPIYRGIKQASDVIGSTLGPNGKTVLYTNKTNTISTKDGYSVSGYITSTTPDVCAGINLIRQACRRQVSVTGDGCEPLWEKIMTPTGYITFAEVKPGDIICGSDGNSQKVLKVYDKGEKELLRLTFSHGESVVCSPDHMWTLKKARTGKLENKKVEELYDDLRDTKGGYKWALPSKPIVNFAPQSVTIDPYLLGAYLGDGHVMFKEKRPNSPNVCFTLGYKKQSVLGKIYSTYPEEDIRRYEEPTFVRLRLTKDTGRMVFSQLCDLGLFGKGSTTKFIPSSYLFNSQHVREELLNGLFATDGYVKTDGRIGYTTASERLAEDVKFLAQSLGYSVHCRKRVRQEKRAKFKKKEYTCYDLLFYKDPIKLKSIEHLGYKEPVRCIKVSNPDELYLTSNCLVTHNTTSTAILALAMIDNVPRSKSKQLLKTIHDVIECIDEDKVKNKQYHGLFDAAMVSSNGDKEISQCVAECVSKNGKDGHYIVEEQDEAGLKHEQLDGYIFDSGYAHSAFVNTKHGCELKNPVIFIKEYVTLADIAQPATDAIKADKPFVVIGQPDEQCLASLVSNHLNGNGSYCVIVPRQVGQKKRDILADISYVSDNVTKMIIKKGQTIILHNKSLKGYIEKLSNQDTASKAEKDYQKERIARLESKVCKIYIGANSVAALRERKDRLEDAILSTISSMDGVIPGAGHYLNSLKTPFPKVFKAIYKRVGLKKIDSNIVDSAEVVKQSLLNAYECYQIFVNSKHSLHDMKVTQ